MIDSRSFLFTLTCYRISFTLSIYEAHFSFGRRNSNIWMSNEHPRTTIISFGVPSALRFGRDKVFCFGTDLLSANGYINICKASGAETVCLLMISLRHKKTLLILSKYQSPRPRDIDCVSTAIDCALV